MHKKVTYGIILSVLVLFLVSGCQRGKSNSDDNKLDYSSFTANYKQDQNCEWGKRAAVYQNGIYYSDPQNGGIFSMDLDGNQCHLVLKSLDIRKIQLTNEGIYYLNFIGNATNFNGEYRSFRLFFSDWKTYTAQNLQNTTYDANNAEQAQELWDFYRTKNGIIANICIDWADAPYTSPSLSLFYTFNKGKIRSDQFTFLRKYIYAIIPGAEYPWRGEIATYHQLYFAAESNFGSPDPFFGQYNPPSDSFSVTDQQENQMVMNTDNVPYIFGDTEQHRTIDRFLPDGVLVHIQNEMTLMSQDFQKAIRSILLDGEEIIRYVVVSDDKAYIIADQGEQYKQQSVYEMDLDTFTYQKLYKCARDRQILKFGALSDESILWLDAEKLVTVQEKLIRIWELKDGSYQLNRTLKTRMKIVNSLNQTDVAGDWLFVYQFNEANNRDELLMKLNIAIE